MFKIQPRQVALAALAALVIFTHSKPGHAASEQGLDTQIDATLDDAATVHYTLQAALVYAEAHQPTLRSAVAAARTRSAQTVVARRQWLPSLGINAQGFFGTSNNSTAVTAPSSVVLLPRIGGTSASHDSPMRGFGSALAAVGVMQEVYDFGRISAESAEADAQRDVADQDVDASLLDLHFNVREAFYAVSAAKSICASSQEAADRARIHRDMAQASVNVGLRSPVDLARTEALLGQLDVGVIRAQGDVRSAQSVLATAMGAPQTLVDITETAESEQTLPTLAQAMERMRQANPQILRASSRIHAQEAQTQALGAQARPNLNFTASFSGRGGGAGNAPTRGDGFAPEVLNWDIGLMLNWPLYDGVILARRDVSVAAEQERREELAAVQQKARAALQQALIAATVARVALPALQQSMDAARVNYNQTNARFESGLGTSLELADAENVRVDAETKFSLGKFEAARAIAALDRLIAAGLVEKARD